MNLYLHGIGTDESPIRVSDSLASDPGDRFDMMLTNPPFGKKSSVTVVSRPRRLLGIYIEQAAQLPGEAFLFRVSCFVFQHVKTLLKINGRAGIVVPDNVLFEGGAGEAIRKRLLRECDVHTLLRLPTGVFYAQGVKANVLFFDRKEASEAPWTKTLWIYDLRTNMHFTLKTNPLKQSDLDDFVASYNPENRHDRKESERFKAFTYDELVRRDKTSLDIFWLPDESLEDSGNLPDPAVLAAEIVEDLQAALDQFSLIATDLAGSTGSDD
jgi:type I restriction enzyme M protein